MVTRSQAHSRDSKSHNLVLSKKVYLSTSGVCYHQLLKSISKQPPTTYSIPETYRQVDYCSIETILSVWSKEIFLIIVICVSRYVFLKCVDERFLLFKDKHIGPNIDKVMVINIFGKIPLKRE